MGLETTLRGLSSEFVRSLPRALPQDALGGGASPIRMSLALVLAAPPSWLQLSFGLFAPPRAAPQDALRGAAAPGEAVGRGDGAAHEAFGFGGGGAGDGAPQDALGLGFGGGGAGGGGRRRGRARRRRGGRAGRSRRGRLDLLLLPAHECGMFHHFLRAGPARRQDFATGAPWAELGSAAGRADAGSAKSDSSRNGAPAATCCCPANHRPLVWATTRVFVETIDI